MEQKAFKLFRVKYGGKLFPLYIDTNEEMKIGVWLQAKAGEPTEDGKVKSKLGKLAYRPGFHCCGLPLADHIGKKMNNGKLCQASNTVWCEVLMNTSVDYTENVKKNGKTPRDWCMKRLPESGFYRYRTNPNAKVDWFITDQIKIVRVLSNKEVVEICRQNNIIPQITEEQYNLTQQGEKSSMKSLRERLDSVTTFLNNKMEEYSDYYCNEFGCKKSEIVDQFGFGYVIGDHSISYICGGDICSIPLSLSKIEDKIANVTNREDCIALIDELQGM